MKVQDPLLTYALVGEPTPLTRDDLLRLHEGNRQASSLQRIRASHHSVARLIAAGLSYREVSAYTGYSEVRIAHLAVAPAMKELIAVYIDRIGERQLEAVDAYLELKTSNMIAAERHIADKIAELDEEGELLPIKTALAISADAADRVGYGKRQTNLNVNVDFAAALERAMKRSGKVLNSAASALKVVGSPSPLPTPTPSPSPRLSIARRV